MNTNGYQSIYLMASTKLLNLFASFLHVQYSSAKPEGVLELRTRHAKFI